MEKKIPYNVKGKERRELAQAVSEALNTTSIYKGVPSCAYEIGGCLLDREGTLLIGDSLDSETVNRLLAYLAERGFEGKPVEPGDDYSGLVVSMPRDIFTDKALENLMRLAESKGSLIAHA